MLEYFRMVTSGVLPQSYSKVNTTTVRKENCGIERRLLDLNGPITMLTVHPCTHYFT